MSSISSVTSLRTIQQNAPISSAKPAAVKQDADGDFDGSKAGEVESPGLGGMIDRRA